MRHSLVLGTLALAALVAAPAAAQDKPAVTQAPAASQNTTHGRYGQKIDRIVIHTVEGSQGSAVNTFRAPSARVSAHYVIGRDGSIVQCVADADMAWHAGSANPTSIGIEHEGSSRDAGTWTPALLESSARLTRWLCDTYGIPIDRQHIVGHSEIAGETHKDPGPHFDWTRYLELVKHARPIRPIPVAPIHSGVVIAPPAPASTACVSTATDPGLPLPQLIQSEIAAIESAILADTANQGCFGTRTNPSSSSPSSTTPSSKGNASGSSTAAVSSTQNAQAAAIAHDIGNLVSALDRTFEALEGTIASLESSVAANKNQGSSTTPTTPATHDEPLCSLGSQGDAVKRIQQQLGIAADGIYGPQTQAAVRAFQASHGCKVDGITGPETWGALDRASGSSGSTASNTAPASSSESADSGLGGPLPSRASTSSSSSTSPTSSSTSGGAGEVCQPGDVTSQDGDSLASIAARIGVTEDALAQANPQITSSGYLPVGSVVHVPSGH